MPGITNPAEVYFKDGIWAWATNTWEKLISSGGILYNALHGWDGDSWQKLPMVWGYSDRYVQALSSLGVAAGTRALTFTSPSAGEVWVITHWVTWTSAATPASFNFYLHNTAGYQQLQKSPNPGANTSVVCEGEIILKATDYLYAEFPSCAGGEDIYSSACGYKMKIAE